MPGNKPLWSGQSTIAMARKVYGIKTLEKSGSRPCSISECQMPISKLEAAQQQLDCAIRLLFNLENMPSVITLSRAAFRVLLDIYPVLKTDGNFGTDIDGVIKRMGWSKFNKIANQLKHANNDAE